MPNTSDERVDVLSLEWTTAPSRDRVMATLVCNYLRLQGVGVAEGGVYDGFHLLNKYRPKLFFITNSIGAVENLELMRYAKRRGIPAISLISEGVFMGDKKYLSQLIWGWNKEKVLSEDLHLQWSEVTRNITIQMHPELNGRVKVSGGVGFDNYKIARRDGVRETLLKKYGKERYSKVIGVGCWNFGIFYPEDTRSKINLDLYGDSAAKRFRSDGVAFDRVLVDLISKNQDTLFLLKEHPGVELGYLGSGIGEASKLKNVLVLKYEESIFDCIQASDIWLIYESTTALEAWLLGKPTLLLNPSGRDFPRDRLSEGSPDFGDADSLQTAIDAFYSDGNVPSFSAREEVRRRLIKDYIQWDDGLNHVRAGNEIIDLLYGRSHQNWRDEAPGETISRWRQHAKWQLGPYLRRSKSFVGSAADRRRFSFSQLAAYQQSKLSEQEAFYRKFGLSLADLSKIRCL
jgi:surface carbohydrate biosynthesis protein